MVLISIHIPTYKDDPKLLLEDLKKQTHKDFEILIGDDAQDKKWNDYIKTLCKKYKATYLTRKTRKGFKAGNLNNLLKHSKGTYICLLDADARIDKDYLKQFTKHLKTHDVIQAHWEFYNKGLVSLDLLRKNSFNSFPGIEKLTGSAFIYGSGCIIKRDLIDQWSEAGVIEDYDMNLKLATKKANIHYAKEIVCNCHVPDTIKEMYKQQKRWAHGIVRAATRNRPKLTLRYLTVLNAAIAYIYVPIILFISMFFYCWTKPAVLWEFPIMGVSMYHGALFGLLQIPLQWQPPRR